MRSLMVRRPAWQPEPARSSERDPAQSGTHAGLATERFAGESLAQIGRSRGTEIAELRQGRRAGLNAVPVVTLVCPIFSFLSVFNQLYAAP